MLRPMSRPSARDRILDTAEQLMGERGVGATSLRAINAAAGLSPAALHYHFGSKPALLEAILMRRMPALMTRREALLDALQDFDEPVTARDVVAALVVPLAELITESGDAGARYLRFLARAFEERALDFEFVGTRFAGGTERLEPLLQRALPQLPAAIVRLRLALALETLLRGLANPDVLADLWQDGEPTPDASSYAAALIDFIAGGLEADDRLVPGGIEAPAPRSAAGESE